MGPLFQGSFPLGNGPIQTRRKGAFSFKVLEGREMPWQKKGEMETKKQRNKIKQI